MVEFCLKKNGVSNPVTFFLFSIFHNCSEQLWELAAHIANARGPHFLLLFILFKSHPNYFDPGSFPFRSLRYLKETKKLKGDTMVPYGSTSMADIAGQPGAVKLNIMDNANPRKHNWPRYCKSLSIDWSCAGPTTQISHRPSLTPENVVLVVKPLDCLRASKVESMV